MASTLLRVVIIVIMLTKTCYEVPPNPNPNHELSNSLRELVLRLKQLEPGEQPLPVVQDLGSGFGA